MGTVVQRILWPINKVEIPKQESLVLNWNFFEGKETDRLGAKTGWIKVNVENHEGISTFGDCNVMDVSLQHNGVVLGCEVAGCENNCAR
jgi:hypothetical protein